MLQDFRPFRSFEEAIQCGLEKSSNNQIDSEVEVFIYFYQNNSYRR
jgi:hypothetical protein